MLVQKHQRSLLRTENRWAYPAIASAGTPLVNHLIAPALSISAPAARTGPEDDLVALEGRSVETGCRPPSPRSGPALAVSDRHPRPVALRPSATKPSVCHAGVKTALGVSSNV